MNIERQLIRDKAMDGVLRHAGFRWRQPLPWRETVILRAICTCASAALLTLPIFIMYVKHDGPLKVEGINFLVLATFYVSVFGMVVLSISAYVFRDMTDEQAAVSFSSSDEVWVTRHRRIFNKYATVEWWCLPRRASEVTSIERIPVRNNGGSHYRHGGEDGYLACDVCVYFSTGERLLVGECLTEDDASIVVAQLNLAYRENRLAAAVAA